MAIQQPVCLSYLDPSGWRLNVPTEPQLLRWVFNTGHPSARMRKTHHSHASASWNLTCPWICRVSFPCNCHQESASLSIGQSLFHQRQPRALRLREKIANRWWETLVSASPLGITAPRPSGLTARVLLGLSLQFILSHFWGSLFSYLHLPLYTRKEIAGSYPRLVLPGGHSSFFGCPQASRTLFKATCLYSVLWLPSWWV